MKKFAPWAFVSSIFLVVAWLSASLITQQKNNLYLNGNWDSSKISLHKGVVGAVAFFTTRTALAKDRLDLGAWHGFNEVTYKVPVVPGSVRFEFEIENKADLSLIFDKSEAGFKGLRITTNPNFQSGFFEADELGKFVSFVPVSVGAIQDGRNSARVDFKDNAVFYLNGKESGSAQFSLTKAGLFGFRGETGKTIVDNIHLTEKNGNEISENFSPKNRVLVFLILALFFTLLVIFVYFFAPHRTTSLNNLGLFSVSILFFTGLLHAFDHFYYSGLYPTNESQIAKLIFSLNLSEFPNNIEYHGTLLPAATETLARAKTSDFKVVLLGSSQTWGAGATKEGEDIASVLKAALQKKLKRNVVIANFAVSGDTTTQMVDSFKLAKDFKYDLVILNASNNDGGGLDFNENVKQIVQIALGNGAKCFLVQEPNFIDEIHEYAIRNHRDLESIANNTKIGVIKLQKYLDEKRNIGFLWWDNVHLTSLGQKLAAEFIADSVLEK